MEPNVLGVQMVLDSMQMVNVSSMILIVDHGTVPYVLVVIQAILSMIKVLVLLTLTLTVLTGAMGNAIDVQKATI